MSSQTVLYPLTFMPIYKEKVWGGRALESLGRALPGDASNGIGESWEIADLATTSISGGGGNAEYSTVKDGPLQGQTIRQLMQQFSESLLGRGVSPSDDGGFPLLIKFLDAKENLSVQVHPSPAYAAKHEDAYLKSEAWYVIDCEPGAVIYKGLAPDTTPEQLRAALETNTDEAVAPLLNAIPVKPGDCHYLPSGTLHALGAGVLVAEVQTPSDTTYRVYDWGRTDRELHIEQAMACIDFDSTPAEAGTAVSEFIDGFEITHKAACDFFTIDAMACNGPASFAFTLSTAEVWIALRCEGDAAFQSANEPNQYPLSQGQTALLPANLGPTHFTTQSPGTWLRVTMPTK